MSPSADFFDLVFESGRAVLQCRPNEGKTTDPKVTASLARAFTIYRREVAGPPIEFDAATATVAAGLLHQACWFSLNRQDPDAALDRLLALPGPPRSASEHLSADLTLRYLPQIYRRAKAQHPADRLTVLLEEVLRRWPLSGVLADLQEGPLTPLTFDNHRGLLLMYAERLARHEKAAWVPEGPEREYVELVYAELGKDST
jgi:hypothetical protein